MTPLVSILTPSFNQLRWLKDNVRSVASQTYPTIEHVIMDGASTDGTVDFLSTSADPRLHWRSEPDRGQSHALNKAFAVADGTIIGWLNSDDAYFSRHSVARIVRVFEAHPEVGVVYGHGALVNGDGLVLQLMWAPPFSRRLLKLHNFISQPTAFFRRELIDGYLADETFHYAMDRELWLRLAQRAKFTRVDTIVALDRHHRFRKSYNLREAARRDTQCLIDRYGVPEGKIAVAERKALKIAFRYAGLGLLKQVRESDLAFDGTTGPISRLVRRQIASTRRAMSFDGRG